MQLLITSEYRFCQSPDGAVWTEMAFPNSFWGRYLAAFSGVLVVARVEEIARPPAGWSRVDGHGVRVWPIPYYVGLKQFALSAAKVLRNVRGLPVQSSAVLLRVPSTLATLVYHVHGLSRRPYALEVVGDPREAFTRQAFTHPLRQALRPVFVSELKRQCRGAAAVAYVSRHVLPERYPARPSAEVSSYSSIELLPEAFVDAPRPPAPLETVRLVTVGSLETRHKGVDVLLRAVRQCLDQGISLRLEVIGDGRFRGELEELVDELDLAEHVTFMGRLAAGAPVRERLDRADVFVLPSRTEGLPRAMIEAMARGLPCLGSDAGGIPELLGPAERAPVEDHRALGQMLRALSQDLERRARLSRENLERAQRYSESVLRERRSQFYRALEARTAEHIGVEPAGGQG